MRGGLRACRPRGHGNSGSHATRVRPRGAPADSARGTSAALSSSGLSASCTGPSSSRAGKAALQCTSKAYILRGAGVGQARGQRGAAGRAGGKGGLGGSPAGLQQQQQQRQRRHPASACHCPLDALFPEQPSPAQPQATRHQRTTPRSAPPRGCAGSCGAAGGWTAPSPRWPRRSPRQGSPQTPQRGWSAGSGQSRGQSCGRRGGCRARGRAR